MFQASAETQTKTCSSVEVIKKCLHIYFLKERARRMNTNAIAEKLSVPVEIYNISKLQTDF